MCEVFNQIILVSDLLIRLAQRRIFLLLSSETANRISEVRGHMTGGIIGLPQKSRRPKITGRI